MSEELTIVDNKGIIELPTWSKPKTIDNAKEEINLLGLSFHAHGYKVGKYLIWVKKEVGHGEFLNWLEKNIKFFSEKTAERLMSFARQCDKIGYLMEYHPKKDENRHGDEFEYKISDVWNFSECDDRFGMEYPGRIPGQIVQNLLHYYTNKDDIIIDFMAGGGTTQDVCEFMKMKCYSFDREPKRDFIVKHQLRTKDKKVTLPKLKEKPNLIFVDPPYWSMMKEDYGKDSISELSLKDYYKFIKEFAEECFKILPKNGIVAFLIQNQTERDIPEGEESIPHTYNCTKIFEDVGFKLRRIINCPNTLQNLLHEVKDVKDEDSSKMMLGCVRDLIIFKKE